MEIRGLELIDIQDILEFSPNVDKLLFTKEQTTVLSAVSGELQESPAIHHTKGLGVDIRWQQGPFPQNGATIEDVLLAAHQRLQMHQESPFCCAENRQAQDYIELALQTLVVRQIDRKREADGE